MPPKPETFLALWHSVESGESLVSREGGTSGTESSEPSAKDAGCGKCDRIRRAVLHGTSNRTRVSMRPIDSASVPDVSRVSTLQPISSSSLMLAPRLARGGWSRPPSAISDATEPRWPSIRSWTHGFVLALVHQLHIAAGGSQGRGAEISPTDDLHASNELSQALPDGHAGTRTF